MATELSGEDPLECYNKENQGLQTICIIILSLQDPQL